MKKRVQGLIAGILIGTLITGGAAFAKNLQKTIDAVYMNIKLVIDGEEITPKDANGNIVEPFIYNGTTYLPVRAIGEAFDKDVHWDGENATVFVGDIQKPAREVLLYDKPYLECGYSSEFIAGKSDKFNYVNNPGTCFVGFDFTSHNEKRNSDTNREEYSNYIVYPLNGLAKKVKGTFIAPETLYHSEYQFKFFNESGKLLYTSPIMTGNTAPVDFEFETKNTLKLKIQCQASVEILGHGPTCFINNLSILTTDY